MNLKGEVISWEQQASRRTGQICLHFQTSSLYRANLLLLACCSQEAAPLTVTSRPSRYNRVTVLAVTQE